MAQKLTAGGPAIAVVVGLKVEAPVARLLGCPVEIGGGSPEGASRAARRAIEAGAATLISFGLAGGLDPALRPGALLIPAEIWVEGRVLPTDPATAAALGGPTPGRHCAGDRIAVTAADKDRLRAETGCAAVDLETGAIARVAEALGRRFAVLRAVCDPADVALPPAALLAMDEAGAIDFPRLLGSILRQPGQILTLITLARAAAAARQALRHHIGRLERFPPR